MDAAVLTDPVRDWLPVETYPGYRPGLPDVVLARLPGWLAGMAGQDFKSWILENHKEKALLEARLGEILPITENGSLDFIRGPDSAVRKPGKGASNTDIVAALYSPPRDGWPYLLLFSWPFVNPDAERGRYTWEVFAESQEAFDFASEMCKKIGLPIEIGTPDDLVRQ